MANASVVPIGVFWDIENCNVPRWKSALPIVKSIRENFFAGRREVEFLCVCDTTKESRDVLQDLTAAQVDVVHINATSKNAADDKLRQSLRRFTDTHPPPAAVLLISSDVNFASDLSDMRHRKGYHVILVHSKQTHEALKLCANEHFLYEDLVKDIPRREPDMSEHGNKELLVMGFPNNQPSRMVEHCLRKLSTNCGGRVVSVTASTALLRFSSHNDAVKAKKRMKGEQVFGSKIEVQFAVDTPGSVEDPDTGQGSPSDKKDSPALTPYKRPRRRRVRRSKSREPPEQSEPVIKNNLATTAITADNRVCSSKIIKVEKMTTQLITSSCPNQDAVGDGREGEGQSNIKNVVDKFSKDKRSSRQVLLLQQQLYQEGQESRPRSQPQSQPDPRSQPQSQPDPRSQPYQQSQLQSRPHPQSQLQSQPHLQSQPRPHSQPVLDNRHTSDNSGFTKGQGHYSMFGQSYDDQTYQQRSSYGYYSQNSWGQNHYQNYSSYYGNNSSHYGNNTGYHGNSTAHNTSMDVSSFYGYNQDSMEGDGGYRQPPPPDLNRSFCSSELVRRTGSYRNQNTNYRSHPHSLNRGYGGYGEPGMVSQYSMQRQSPYNNYAPDRQSPQQTYNTPSHLPDRSSPYMNAFQPIRSDSPSTTSSSPCEQDSVEWDNLVGPVELLVSNLDYNISAKEWRKILFTTFHPHVGVLNVHVKAQPDNTSIGMVKVPSKEEARFAISQFHRKKIGYKRIHVTLKNDEGQRPASTTRAEAVTLLLETKDNMLPLFKFIELFDKRYHRSISVSELYKMRDVIDIREQGGAGRMVYLTSRPQQVTPTTEVADGEIQEILEQPLCMTHCPEGSTMYAEAINSCMLPYVKMSIKMLGPQVHSLLQTHDGNMPLMSFPMCYIAEFSSLPISLQSQGGVPLEHLISCVPGIQIQVSPSGVKKVQWAENPTPNSTDPARPMASPLLSQQLNQICREMTDLLKQSAQCRMPMSKFIPSYHHFFGRQCRVADYGYSRLKDLFEAIPHVVQVLGTGDRKLLTLSHRAQIRRFTADLTKLLKGQPGKKIAVKALSGMWSKFYNKAWDITEYGMSHLDDLLAEIPPSTAMIVSEGGEGVIAIPRKDQSVEEVERTRQFSLEVVDLLRHNPQCRMPFNKFIPAYHHHFGRQCRVSDYGFSKLMDLFEAIPHVVEMEEDGEERMIHLTEPELRKILAEQVVGLLKYQKNQCLPLHHLMSTFTCHYGFNIPLCDFNVESEEDLMRKLRHVVKVEMVNRCKYVMLVSKTEMPRLAYQVMQLMMDQSGGSLPLLELASRYKSQYGHDCDVKQLKEELLDYVQVIGDDESAVISLTPLQAFARDVRLLLHEQGRLYLSQFDRVYKERFGVELKPALFGYPTTLVLLQTIPYIACIKGKGPRKYCTLVAEFKAGLPPYKTDGGVRDHPHRSASDTQSSDSGVTDNNPEDDDLCVESLKPLAVDLLSAPVPSAIPSPDLNPEEPQIPNLMTFETPITDLQEQIWTLTEHEKRGQKTPLCRTPTSELLNFAAQCLISHPPRPASRGVKSRPTTPHPTTASEDIQGQTSAIQGRAEVTNDDQGWWKASPSQLSEIRQSFAGSLQDVQTRPGVDGAGPVRGRDLATVDHSAGGMSGKTTCTTTGTTIATSSPAPLPSVKVASAPLSTQKPVVVQMYRNISRTREQGPITTGTSTEQASPVTSSQASPIAKSQEPSLISPSQVSLPVATVAPAPSIPSLASASITSLTSAPIASLPSAPITSLPSVPITSLPSAPITSLPSAPITSLPSAPITSLPSAPIKPSPASDPVPLEQLCTSEVFTPTTSGKESILSTHNPTSSPSTPDILSCSNISTQDSITETPDLESIPETPTTRFFPEISYLESVPDTPVVESSHDVPSPESRKISGTSAHDSHVENLKLEKSSGKGKDTDTTTKYKIIMPKCPPKEKTIQSLTDSTCYDNMFRQDPPLDTSSVKSDTSSVSDVSQGSPRKSPRKHRIAARFDNPMELATHP